jgi:excisionase family DNA binding protein
MEPVVLTVKEARAYLRISARLLWQLIAPRGPIPVVKAGKRVLYRRADLDRFLADSAARSLEAATATKGKEVASAQRKSPGASVQ